MPRSLTAWSSSVSPRSLTPPWWSPPSRRPRTCGRSGTKPQSSGSQHSCGTSNARAEAAAVAAPRPRLSAVRTELSFACGEYGVLPLRSSETHSVLRLRSFHDAPAGLIAHDGTVLAEPAALCEQRLTSGLRRACRQSTGRHDRDRNGNASLAAVESRQRRRAPQSSRSAERLLHYRRSSYDPLAAAAAASRCATALNSPRLRGGLLAFPAAPAQPTLLCHRAACRSPGHPQGLLGLASPRSLRLPPDRSPRPRPGCRRYAVASTGDSRPCMVSSAMPSTPRPRTSRSLIRSPTRSGNEAAGCSRCAGSPTSSASGTVRISGPTTSRKTGCKPSRSTHRPSA